MKVKGVGLLFVLITVCNANIYGDGLFKGSFYRDTTGAATIQEIVDANFSSISFPYELRPYEDEAYWIRVDLQNLNKFIVFSDWSFIEFFMQDQSGNWINKRTGHLVPYLERDIPLNNRLVIEVPATVRPICYVRLRFSTNSFRIPHTIQPLSMSAAQLMSDKLADDLVGPFLQGFLLCIFVFVMFLYYFSRDNALTVFGVYLLLWVYIISHNSGHLIAAFSFIDHLPSYVPFLDISIGSSLITIVAILVMYRLIDIKAYFSFEKRLFDLLIGILAFLPFAALFTPHKLYVVLLDYIVVSVVVAGFLYISIRAYLKKISFSLFFLLANLPFFVGTLVYLISATGFIYLPTKIHDIFLLFGVLCQSVFFTVIFSFRYNRLTLKNAQKKRALSQQNLQLSSMTLNLSRKNTVLEQVKKISKRSSSEPELKPLLKIIEQDLAFDNKWEEFKLHFEKVNHGFFGKLIAKHPTLTANEQKLCAYLKLSLSTKEIAQLLHRPPASVEKARYRLRKKMGLTIEQNLSSYLHHF